MSTTVQASRKKAVISASKKRAVRLLHELPEDKIKVALPFLEFLKFLDQNGNDKEFDPTNSIKRGLQELAKLKAGKLRPKSFEALLDEL